MGVASLVLGILATIIGLFSAGALGWLGAILGIIGIILGALGRKQPQGKGVATAGLVLSIIGFILNHPIYCMCCNPLKPVKLYIILIAELYCTLIKRKYLTYFLFYHIKSSNEIFLKRLRRC